MRRLEFRAWDIKRKTYNHEELLLAPNGDILASRWQELREPESIYILEQYTGLKDKNGREVYEGDIVRYGRRLRGIVPPESHTEIVSWRFGEEEYYPCCTTSGFYLPYSEDGYEVIGNIHENPELIGKEK